MSIVRKSTAKKVATQAPAARKASGSVGTTKGKGLSRKPTVRKVHQSVVEPTHFSRDEIYTIVSSVIAE